MGLAVFEIKLVQRVPEELEPGLLYVCFDCNVIVHLCACGCGKKVVLPIAPDFWRVKYNGEAVSLFPSIGNFQFPCKSHYWIRENVVVWADDQHQEDNYNAIFSKRKKRPSFWSKLKNYFSIAHSRKTN